MKRQCGWMDKLTNLWMDWKLGSRIFEWVAG